MKLLQELSQVLRYTPAARAVTEWQLVPVAVGTGTSNYGMYCMSISHFKGRSQVSSGISVNAIHMYY